MTEKWYISGSTGQNAEMIRTFGDLNTVRTDVDIFRHRTDRLHKRIADSSKEVIQLQDHNQTNHD